MYKFKNLFLLSAFCFLLSALVFWRCSKTEGNDSSASTANSTDRTDSDPVDYQFKYYLNGTEVTSLTIDTTTDNWIAYLAYAIDGTNDALIEVRKFSTKSAYIQFGNANNVAVEKSLLIGEHLNHIADSAGVIAYYESTGLVPSWYTDYETSYINGLGINSGVQDRGPLNMLYKGCGESSSIPVWLTYPVMPYTWNDKTRKVQFLGVPYGGLSMFEKSFYRRHMGIVRGFTFNSFCLVGTSADLKMSSCISL